MESFKNEGIKKSQKQSHDDTFTADRSMMSHKLKFAENKIFLLGLNEP